MICYKRTFIIRIFGQHEYSYSYEKFQSRLFAVSTITLFSGPFTLVDSSRLPHIGEAWALLLYYGGTVCDDDFGMDEAHTLCRYLGYTEALKWGSVRIQNGHSIELWSIQNSYSITMDAINCPTDGDWGDCTFRTSHNCNHNEDVFLYCTGK